MKLKFGLILMTSLLGSQNLWAWYDHTTLQHWIAPQIVPSHVKTSPTRFPTRKEQEYQFENLAALLLLNPDAKLKSYDAKTWQELITLSTEDPDHGIDKDLPDSADPSNDRKWMGGLNHPGTQGFRHMLFQGFKIGKPFTTFQIPFRQLGQAQDRFDLLTGEAKKRIQEKDLFWGMRLLGWSLHYIQDLTQPFHTVQVPSLRMVPWSRVIGWNPAAWSERYIKESDRTITNYHWAYEGFVRSELLKKENSVFAPCFKNNVDTILAKDPRDLALQVANRSIETSRELGNVVVDFFGTDLKDPAVDYPKGKGVPGTNTGNEKARKRLIELTCSYFKTATSASAWVVNWAFHP